MLFTRPTARTLICWAGLDEVAAAIHVVVGELLLHLRDAQPIGDQLVRIEANLIFARGAAEAGNIHNIRHGLECFSTTQSSSDFSSITSYWGLVLCRVKK